MRTIPFLYVVTIVAHCDITNICTEVKRYFAGHRDARKVEISILTKSEEIAAESKDYKLNLDRSVLKTNEGDVGRIVFQNKTILTEKQKKQTFNDIPSGSRPKRQVLKDHFGLNTTWRDGVFYTFNTTDHNVQRVFKMGAKIWSDLTCVDFFEDKDAKDKVVVVKESGSSSSIGRCGGDQLLSIGENSPVASGVHEIGHVLGLFHTMSRYDRDGYIRIVMENVDRRCRDMFEKLSSDLMDVYGFTYEYGSIMHYNELSCSVNQKPTMIATYPQYQKTMGSDLISFSDVFMINEHYGCNEKCNKSTSAKCVNEGYPHPRNCSICICPRGYGGALCDRRPPGCGEDLVATHRKRTVVYRLGSGSDLRDQFDFCNYMITAPEGKKIEVDIRSISSGYDEAGCPKGGVEIKAQEDQKLTGYRFCSKKGTSIPIVSSYNRLPVILFNRRGTMEVKFTHRYTS